MKLLVRHASRLNGLGWAAVVSFVVHVVGSVAFWYYPLIATAIGLRGIEFVEEGYDKAILIDFSKRLSYPPGYSGFRPPEETLSLEEIARREKLQREREQKRRLARERAAARKNQNSSTDESSGKEKELAANQAGTAQPATPGTAAEPAAAPKDGYPGGFGKINTAPIKDQVQNVYNAYKAGKIVLPEGKLKVGVSGRIMPDGTLSEIKVIMPSGLPDIDAAALAILNAVSASHALGPLHEMSSLTMVLNVGEHAELSVVGFTNTEEAAANIVNLANAALLFARFKKSDDPGTMIILNNLKVLRSGKRVQAIIAMPRQKASESLAQSVGVPKT